MKQNKIVFSFAFLCKYQYIYPPKVKVVLFSKYVNLIKLGTKEIKEDLGKIVVPILLTHLIRLFVVFRINAFT